MPKRRTIRCIISFYLIKRHNHLVDIWKIHRYTKRNNSFASTEWISVFESNPISDKLIFLPNDSQTYALLYSSKDMRMHSISYLYMCLTLFRFYLCRQVLTNSLMSICNVILYSTYSILRKRIQ